MYEVMWKKALVAAGVATGMMATSGTASADVVIKNPNDHPEYRAELEPHGVFILWRRRFGRYSRAGRFGNDFGDPEFGGGFRATIEIGDPLFIPSINNTIGITFGADLASCYDGFFCDVQFFFPVGLQWNFFITDKWSTMFEVGPMPRAFAGSGGTCFDGRGRAFRCGSGDSFAFDFFVDIGGRYHFNDDVALTMKIGYPFTFSIGPSFFVGS
jgi:hypothetical protein